MIYVENALKQNQTLRILMLVTPTNFLSRFFSNREWVKDIHLSRLSKQPHSQVKEYHLTNSLSNISLFTQLTNLFNLRTLVNKKHYF